MIRTSVGVSFCFKGIFVFICFIFFPVITSSTCVGVLDEISSILLFAVSLVHLGFRV